MTLRRFVYRYIYLKTPGWDITRQIVKGDVCSSEGCKAETNLHLHHMSYTGFQWWYLLFKIAVLIILVLLFFPYFEGIRLLNVISLILNLTLAFCPDFLSEFTTLCKTHHDLVHYSERNN